MISVERERGSSSLGTPSRTRAPPRGQASASSTTIGNEIEVERVDHIVIE